jgi:large subunit ribosomal protein L7/L12
MENLNTEELLNTLGNLTAPQLVALTKQLEEKWGVSATPQVQTQQVQEQTTQAVEQTEFSVVLVSFPADKKMTLVKLAREQLGLGLLESKALVEAAPKLLKDNLSKEDAEAMRAKFTEAGGVVEVR